MIFPKLVSLNDLYLLIVFALISLANAIPLPRVKPIITDSLGLAAFRLSRNKRRVVEQNLRRLFGNEIDEPELQRIAKESFCEFWRDLFSFCLSNSERTALKQIKIQGKQYLMDAMNSGKGAIVIESSNFGKRNLAKQILHQLGISVHQVHHVRHFGGLQVGSPTFVQQRIVRPILEKWERSFVAEVIYLTASDSLTYAKRLLTLLQKNKVICVSGEGRKGHKHVPLQFLGWTGDYPTGMMNLGKISGAPLLPIFCFQLQNAEPTLIIERPIEFGTNDDRDELLQNALAEYLRLLETYVRKHPGMYRNWQFERHHAVANS